MVVPVTVPRTWKLEGPLEIGMDGHLIDGPRLEPGESVQVVALDDLEGKLDEMTLHDDTGDPQDVGFMAAVNELRELVSRFSAAAHGVSGSERGEGE